jgi:hypothetical protein
MNNPSRKIQPLDTHGCPMRYTSDSLDDRLPPGAVNSNVGQGELDPFSDSPLDIDPVSNSSQGAYREGFTQNWYSTPSSENSVVRNARMSQTPNPPKNYDGPEERHEGGQKLRRVGSSGSWGGGLDRKGPGGMRSTLRDD